VAKPLDDFHAKGPGFQAQCKACRNEARRQANRNRTEAQRAHDRERQRDQDLRRYYGISQVEYDRLSDRQGGRCGICRRDAALHVDHDHESGQVRGLLCHPCNTALGLFGEDPERLLAAAEWIARELDPADV